jgi:hypothetical protein
MPAGRASGTGELARPARRMAPRPISRSPGGIRAATHLLRAQTPSTRAARASRRIFLNRLMVAATCAARRIAPDARLGAAQRDKPPKLDEPTRWLLRIPARRFKHPVLRTTDRAAHGQPSCRDQATTCRAPGVEWPDTDFASGYTRSPAETTRSRLLTCPVVGCQVVSGQVSGWVVGLVWSGVCARAPGLTSVRDPAVWRIGDVMFDGVTPAGGSVLRPLVLSRPSTRRCRQQNVGSRPRRICVSEDSARTD